MKNNILNKSSLIAVLLCALCSCSVFQDSSNDPYKEIREQRQKQRTTQPIINEEETNVKIEDLVDEEHAALSDVEILWKIPEFKLDGVIIRYGSSPDELTETVSLPIEDIRIVQDPKYGPVMHYIVRDVPINQQIFATITGYKEDVEISTSDVASSD